MSESHPFNVLKFCPKCRSSQFNPSGNKSLKCNQCGFHFYLNSAAAVAALVVDEKGKLLLTKRGIEPSYGKLDLPGGFVDPGETVENALIRELKEELCLEVKSFEYLYSASNEYVFSGYCVFTIDLAFKVYPESLNGLKAQDDIIDFKFYSEEELDYNEIPAPSIKKFVKDYFRNERNKK